jgi:peptide-methionine (S)-S-oxide reductase
MGMLELIDRSEALPGRAVPMEVNAKHFVNGNPMVPPFADNLRLATFGLGCFWGAERSFWQLEGVHATAAGYAGGFTPNPTYEEVCTGRTAHAEVVRVVFDPTAITYERLLTVFWEAHDPTQSMRQGADHGTQYRSLILTQDDRQHAAATATHRAYEKRLHQASFPPITTQIQDLTHFYYAEPNHQQYLAQNPNGYCGISGTGVTCSF